MDQEHLNLNHARVDAQRLQMEEIARAGVTGIGFGLHSEIVAPYILHYGTPEQKAKYLPKLASGEMVGAIAMSEPAAGSDLQGVKTTAIEEPDGSYVLNGSKTFITNGANAGLMVTACKLDPLAKDLTLICVDIRSDGKIGCYIP